MTSFVWVADYDDTDHSGGAQQTNRILIEYGRGLGMNIKEVTLKNIEKHPLQSEGTYILNNIARIWEKFPNILTSIIETKKYIRYEHDYLWMGGMDIEMVKKVFNNAKLSIFLSPLHKAEHERMGIEIGKHFLQPSPIDFTTFNKDGIKEREDKVLYLGGIAYHKGIESVFEYANYYPNTQFDLYGWVEHSALVPLLPKNCKIFEPIPHNEIPALLKKYKKLIHLPKWKEPFGRVVAEAYFCGCELIKNDNLGFFSYPWDFDNYEDIKEKMKDSAANFWEKIYTGTWT